MTNIPGFKILKNPGDTSTTAAIHKSGRLGFSISAIKVMGLNENKYISIAVKENEDPEDALYLIIDDKPSNDAFKVIKAGKYVYLSTTALFDEMELNYRNDKYYYKLRKFDENHNIYKLSRKELKKQKR